MKKILIVDDELAYVQLLTDQLSAEYTVIAAHDGKTGLALAEKEQPDLILLDISMPVMDGLSMLKELRTTAFGKKVNVVMLTNLEPTQDIIRQAITSQPTSYVIKSDTSLEELVQKVKKLC